MKKRFVRPAVFGFAMLFFALAVSASFMTGQDGDTAQQEERKEKVIPVVARGVAEHNLFVGDEQIAIRYFIFAISGVKLSLSDDVKNFDAAPFSVISQTASDRAVVGGREEIGRAHV